ncbi:MAG: hypothetical protein ACE15D_06745 [Candidatus Eisenbacteria bacterium]|nr:hypothetical protein [Candidatus Eisenbacteria bacterium]
MKPVRSFPGIGVLLPLLAAVIGSGCAGSRPTVFLHPDYDFNYVEKVAVIPFENLSQDQGAAFRTTRYFVSELLATGAFEVVEPGEVTRVLEKYGLTRTAELTEQQIVDIGKELSTQALFLGSVGESGTARSGASSTPVITLTARLVEVERGSTVWSATHTEDGRSFWGSLLGSDDASASEVTRRCVDRTIRTLVH